MQTSAVRRLEPLLLLLATGFFIGLFFPLGRLAGDAGIPPLLFAGLGAAGGSVVLAAISLVFRAEFPLDRASLFYAAVAGQLTFAVPFGLLNFVIPHVGSGIPAILQGLTPIVTLAVVAMIGLERPRPLRILGVALGVSGAAIILVSRSSGHLQTNAPFGWYLAALITPITLSLGNVYRSTGWPPGRSPLSLATLTLAAAAITLLLLLILARSFGAEIEIAAPLANGWRLVLMLSLAIGFGYAFFFRLQQVGGPVYLSQISYVNTAVGVGFALLVFAENLSSLIWVAMVLVLAGVALVNRTQPAR